MTKDHALVVLRDGGQTREWLVEADLVIGRDPACDVHLPDRQVSRRHATVRRVEDGYVLIDHASKNGTWLNGVPVVGSTRLKDGDEVSIAARLKLYFVDAEATAPVVFEGHGIRLDVETLSVYVGGAMLDPPLSAPQWELLLLLTESAGAAVTRDEIVRRVWPDAAADGVSDEAVDALVRRLRQRLAELDPDHQYIVNLRRYGFRLVNA